MTDKHFRMAEILESVEFNSEMEGANDIETRGDVSGFSAEVLAALFMSFHSGLFVTAFNFRFDVELKLTFGTVFVEGACAVFIVGFNVFFVLSTYFGLCNFLILLDRLRGRDLDF